MTSLKRSAHWILAVIPLFIFMASEGAEPESSGLMDFIGKSVNFIILFGGLAYLLAKPVKAFLEKKSLDVRKGLEEAAASKKTAEQKLEEIQQRIKKLEGEAAAIREAAEEDGRKGGEKILEQARREAERIKSLAAQDIDMQVKAGIRDIRSRVADLAVALAEERIRKKLPPETQERLIDQSIERLEELYEKSDPD